MTDNREFLRKKTAERVGTGIKQKEIPHATKICLSAVILGV